MIELDPEEIEAQRVAAQERAATSNVIICGELKLRPMSMATYVMLNGTGNGFIGKAPGRRRLAAFDAAAFVWMHAAPESEVFSCDWQDPGEFTVRVTQWMAQFSGRQILEFARVAAAERDRYMMSEFQITPDMASAPEKKSKSGRRGR